MSRRLRPAQAPGSAGPTAMALAAALVLAFAGCGGDDDEGDGTIAAPPPTTPAQPETAPAPTQTEPSPSPVVTETEAQTEPEPSPEDEPGGAGDEEPARSLALFTADNGQIEPRLVRVPAFISIRVELRSRDGNPYGLTIGGKTIQVGDGLGSMSTTLDGLRPGAVLVGTPTGARGRVRIAATAEPGP